jgi:hypothetical protein
MTDPLTLIRDDNSSFYHGDGGRTFSSLTYYQHRAGCLACSAPRLIRSGFEAWIGGY